jgi:hypothetical protein
MPLRLSMESVMNGLDMNIAVIYIDDVIIPGATFEQATDRQITEKRSSVSLVI